jgi:hypothetical protein
MLQIFHISDFNSCFYSVYVKIQVIEQEQVAAIPSQQADLYVSTIKKEPTN